jgi:hypothetical protein
LQPQTRRVPNLGGPKLDHYEQRGSGHCGNLRWTLRSQQAVTQLPVRTCGCWFCRKHGLLTTSDPQGEMDFIVSDRAALLRYRFDTASADFLMCGRCEVYVGARTEEAGRLYGIANLRTLESGDERGAISLMDFSRENERERRARRASRWTPGARSGVRLR